MDLAKVGVEGSNPFARSRINKKIIDMRTATGAASAYMWRRRLPRLGSRVRIPSPAPELPKIKGTYAARFCGVCVSIRVGVHMASTGQARSVLLAGKVGVLARGP